jgi:predicted XRE-type DNA-binding protein
MLAAAPVLEEPPKSAEVQLKLALMRAIDTDLKRRFRTLADAAEFANVDHMRLSRIRSGRYEYFSIQWLFRLAQTAKVHIRISVDPVNR